MAALCDLNRVFDAFRQIREPFNHFRGRLESMLNCDPTTVFLGQISALPNAQKRVMRIVHVSIFEKDVVRGHQWQISGVGLLHKPPLGLFLVRRSQRITFTVALQFDVEPVAKDLR